jgi:hypothetical protein
MRVPYSVFKDTRTSGVKVNGKGIERVTHVPRSGPSLSQITNNPVPFSPDGLWSECGGGTQSSHRDLCTMMEPDSTGTKDMRLPCEAGHLYRRSKL